MAAPPYGAGPTYPPSTGPYAPTPYPAQPPVPYGYPQPPPAMDPLVSMGGALATLGGLIIGIGWLLPLEVYWVVIGIGWLMFGPGVGISLIGLGRQRAGIH